MHCVILLKPPLFALFSSTFEETYVLMQRLNVIDFLGIRSTGKDSTTDHADRQVDKGKKKMGESVGELSIYITDFLKLDDIASMPFEIT